MLDTEYALNQLGAHSDRGDEPASKLSTGPADVPGHVVERAARIFSKPFERRSNDRVGLAVNRGDLASEQGCNDSVHRTSSARRGIAKLCSNRGVKWSDAIQQIGRGTIEQSPRDAGAQPHACEARSSPQRQLRGTGRRAHHE